MASGAALVAARACAAEFVVEDGVTGVLTAPRRCDSAGYGSGTADSAIPHRRIAMGERHAPRVEEKFSLDAEANAIAAV